MTDSTHDNEVPEEAHDEIKKRLHAIQREIVPESQIKAMIDARVSQVEAEIRKDLNAQLSSLEDTLKRRSNEDRAERSKIEAAQGDLSERLQNLQSTTDNKFTAINESFALLQRTITEKMDLILTVVQNRDSEIKEIHADVNANQADVKANRSELTRLESDYRNFSHSVGDALAVLVGKNPFDPAATRILTPLPEQVNALAVKLDEINQPVKRLLELEEKRERFKAKMWDYAQRVVTSRWFWAGLVSALGGPSALIILQNVLSNQ